MRIIYNGIDLFAIETHEFTAEPVYDDTLTDYLYTKYTVVVTAMMNGQVRVTQPNLSMSYEFTGAPVGPTPPVSRAPSPFVGTMTPGAPVGSDPIGIAEAVATGAPRGVVITPVTTPITHQAVRHRLTTPRAPLYIFAGGGMETGSPPAGGFGPPNPAVSELFLSSPQAPTSVDAKNGPIPKILSIPTFHGDSETLMVDFAVETYINEAEQNNARPFSSLLSNRWKQRHSVDAAGWTTIVTAGLAIFRTDLVYFEDNSPDLSRQIIFEPIPPSFTRIVDYVETSEDVTGITYGYTDTQVPVNFVAGPFIGAGEITAVHRQSVAANVDLLGAAIGMGERGVQMILNAKWLKGEGRPGRGGGGTPPPAAPGGPGARRLLTPGVGPRPWKPMF